MDLEVAVALISCGELRRERIPALAAELLEAGTDTPVVRELAGLAEAELDRAHELFRKVMAELGLSMPSRAEAAETVARHVASIAMKPGANLRGLAAEGARLAIAFEYHDALMPFYVAHDEYDMPGFYTQADVDERLLSYAKSLLGKP